MDTFLHEVRLAGRKLRRDPFLAGVSVIAFALGIGLTASMFSIAHSVLMKGMPFDNPRELFSVTRTLSESGQRTNTTSFRDFLDWEKAQTTFPRLGAWQTGVRDLVDDQGGATRVSVTFLSPAMIPLLGRMPAAGRAFGPDEMGPDAKVALVSDALWRDRYGSDPGLLGGRLSLNGEGFTVIGIMPPGFSFPDQQDLWLPLPYDPVTTSRGQAFVRVLGRIPSGVDPGRAGTEINTLAARLTTAYPETNPPAQISLVPLVHTFLSQQDMRLLWTLVVSSFFVLMIACANVANLLAARALDRSGDVAVAIALGATGRRIVGQLFLEALLLALVGGAMGVGLAMGCVRWFDGALGPRKPVWMTFEIDGPVLAFIALAALLSAVVAALTPALRSARVSVRDVLQDESRGASSRQLGRLSRGMVILTITLAYPLLVGAGLLITSFHEASRELVPDPDRVLVVQLSLPARRYPEPVQWRGFWDEIQTWGESQAGVTSVSWGESVPPGNAGRWLMEEEGIQYLRQEDHPSVRMARIRPGFFETLDVAPLRGRSFTPQDRTGPPVAIVNRSFADRFFPGREALGRRVRVVDLGDDPWHTVVGVVPDLRMNGTEEDTPEGLYLPSPPADLSYGHLVFRTSQDTSPLVSAVRDQVSAMDSQLPILRSETLAERVDRGFWYVTVIGSVFSAFGLAALFLASVGLYGVMAHSVSRRTREIGVRRAMGASGWSLVWMILRSSLVQVGVGLAAGGVLALWGTRVLGGVLVGVQAWDVGILASVGAVLVASAVVATLRPALRATGVSMVAALRGE